MANEMETGFTQGHIRDRMLHRVPRRARLQENAWQIKLRKVKSGAEIIRFTSDASVELVQLNRHNSKSSPKTYTT